MAKENALPWILVADVEAHAMGPVIQYLEGKTTADALGRLWTSNADATVALEKAKAEWQTEIGLRSEYDGWLKDRAARRTALMQKTREDLGGGTTPASSGRVYVAQQEALTEFDAREPELGFYEWKESRSTMAGAR